MRRATRLHGWMVIGMMACSSKSDDTASEVFTFDNLTDAEKAAYMASDVLPRMQAVFQDHDATAYADFSCTTCHVAGSADGSYVMPDPGLPPLREDAFPYEDDVGIFMAEEVLPAMAELLGPTDGGRPCITCHTLED